MPSNAISPEDILPDDVNESKINGIQVRKGTVAAVLANIDILENSNATEDEKNNAISMITQLAPALVAIGLHKHVVWKNKKVQALIDKIRDL